LPGCEAGIVHEPAPVRRTCAPVTVQLPLAPNVTGRPDEALALTVKSGSPNVLLGSDPKVMVWPAFAIENVRATGVAAS
jgi:hypothetical protein